MRTMEAKQCAICERTLLVGERPLRFAPDGVDEFVDVCALCQEIALDHGWVREGSPIGPAVRHTAPPAPAQPGAHLRREAAAGAEPIVAEPILRRLSQRRAGASRGGGALQRERRGADGRRASRAASASRRRASSSLSGAEPRGRDHARLGDLLVPVPGQPDSPQPVRLAERGLELGELDPKFTDWNARFEPGAGVLPDLENPV